VQEQALVAIESITWTLACRGVHSHIGHVVQPSPTLLIEVRIIAKRPTVNEIVAQVADGTLDLALGLRSVRATRARREAPVVREAKKFEIAHQRPALQALQERLGGGVRIRVVDVADDPALARRYRVLSLPTTIVLRADKSVAAVNSGFAGVDMLERQLVDAGFRFPELASA